MILILASAVHSPVLRIEMDLLTCEAELALKYLAVKAALNSYDLIVPNLISLPPYPPLLGCVTGKPLPAAKKEQTCIIQGERISPGHIPSVLQHLLCARSVHSFKRNSSWQCCRALSSALSLLWPRRKHGQRGSLWLKVPLR